MKQLFSVFTLLAAAATTFAQPAWQQKVDSKIDVTLDDKHHMLYAYEEMTYINNSPDTLKFIYMHLWPNAYKDAYTPFARQQDVNGKTAFYYSKPADKGYIDSVQFTINGESVDHYSSENTPDIARIDLPKPLLPHQSMVIATPFRVKIPKVFSRLGHTRQAYFISQWFPKPAVYDQKGWHPISYLDQGEFYSEYGAYHVSITLPANYVVMATGNCTDEKENAWLDQLSEKPLPTKEYKIRVARNEDSARVSATEMKTIHFEEDNVHDFAWFADKRWIVRKDTVYTPGTHQLVTAYTAFLPSYWQQWKKGTDYLKQTVTNYGKWVGPYQYKTIKAVLGDMHAGGGMEYPTVTIIDRQASSMLETVVVHEAGHNWFYGMLGSNERDHAWMDEGINSFYEQKTTRLLNHDSGSVRKKGFNEYMLLFDKMATHDDQAIDQTAANFEKLNYGLDVYFKTAMSLRWLEAYMGNDNFEMGMHDYFDKWHFHHPYPEDFKACMAPYAGNDRPIDWFFDTVLTSSTRVDFKITRAKTKSRDLTEFTVQNNTGVKAPVLVDMYYHDSVTCKTWIMPFATSATGSLPSGAWYKLRVDDVVADAKPQNNTYRRHAWSHHFGVKLKPLGGLNLDDKDKVYLSPALAYNQFDGIMAGVLLHNLTLPQTRFRFAAAPLYSFETKSVNGAASAAYVWYPRRTFHDIMLQTDFKHFHYQESTIGNSLTNANIFAHAAFTKIAPSLIFTWRHSPLSSVEDRLTFKGYYIKENVFDSSNRAMTGIGITPVKLNPERMITEKNMYGKVTFNHINSRTYNPFSYALEGQAGADFVKVAAEGNLTIDYNKANKHLFIRAYLGKFIAVHNTTAVISRYGLAASYSGINDYLYDGTYLGRTAYNDLASQPVSIQEGGFKVPTFNLAGHSGDWLGALNLETDLPIKLPIRLFFDAGLMPNATPSITNTSSTTLLYDGGVEIKLLQNVASIYIPIIRSSEFDNYLTNTFSHKRAFIHGVSFTLQLQNVNWMRSPARAAKILTSGI